MLNDFLYKALEVEFGSVKVENEGVGASIVLEYGSGVPSWHLPKDGEDGSHGEQYRVNCPFCRKGGRPDTGHHLYISYLTFTHPVVSGMVLSEGRLWAHCFRCNALSEPANRQELEDRIRLGLYTVKNGDAGAVTVDMSAMLRPNEDAEELVSKTSDSVTTEGIRTWVEGYSPVTRDSDKDILEYLGSRGLTWEMIETFRIGCGPVKTPRTGRLLKNGVPWVIVPVVMNGRLVGVQARCPDKFISEGDNMRYWTHPGMRKSTVMYNLDNARSLGVGVLCEGVFDVFKVGRPGICCFGHTLSPIQKRLAATVGGGMIILPDTDKHEDFDSVKDARRLAEEWNVAGVFPLGAHVVVLKEKDAGAMDRQSVWASILAQLPDGKLRDCLVRDLIHRI